MDRHCWRSCCVDTADLRKTGKEQTQFLGTICILLDFFFKKKTMYFWFFSVRQFELRLTSTKWHFAKPLRNFCNKPTKKQNHPKYVRIIMITITITDVCGYATIHMHSLPTAACLLVLSHRSSIRYLACVWELLVNSFNQTSKKRRSMLKRLAMRCEKRTNC